MVIEKRFLLVLLLFILGVVGGLLGTWGPGAPLEWRVALAGLFFLPVTAAALILTGRMAVWVALASGVFLLIVAGIRGESWGVSLADSVLFLAVALVAGRLGPGGRDGPEARPDPKASPHIPATVAADNPPGQTAVPAFADLASGLVRRFKNPVMSIQGASWLLESSEGTTKQEVLEFASIIRLEARNMEVALSNLQEFIRPRRPRFKTANVQGLLDRAIASTTAGSRAPAPSCRMQIHPHASKLECDPELLQIMFECLLLNAIQAMSGGGAIQIDADAVPGGRVSIRIADTGSGLAAGTSHRIFEPFFTTRESGLGLGLPLARQISAAHGGTIEIQSGSEAGTVATVTLPLEQGRK